jgi:hypothetical protein
MIILLLLSFLLLSTLTLGEFAKRVIWSSDLHDGFRCMFATLFADGLGHEVILGGVKDRNLPHAACTASKDVHFPSRPYSPFINGFRDKNQYVSEADVRSNFEYYRYDPDIKRVDAFICFFPMSMCEVWLPFNKTIIYVAGHRYSLGRCDEPRWSRITKHMIEASSHGHIVVSASTYDAAYLNYFTGLNVPVMQGNSQFYASSRYVAPTLEMRPEILVGPLQLGKVMYEKEINAAFNKSEEKFPFKTAKQIYGHFELSNLAAHRAAILYPYTAHFSFGIMEIYSLGIPIFVPSPEFLLELNIVNDRKISHDFYCGDSSYVPPRHTASEHVPSPESSNPADVLYWLRFAEYYRLPYITQFNSFEDLAYKFSIADFAALRAEIKKYLEQWDIQIKTQWSSFMEKHVTNHGTVPQSYEDALKFVVRDSSVQAP